jgi:pilus assembly protein CpaF
MSLADRLESVRRSQTQPEPEVTGPQRGAQRIRVVDPFATVKASVHQSLLDSLGPQL